MDDYLKTLQHLFADLRIGVSLCTRLPVAPAAPVNDGDVARASWTFPIAGVLVGLAAALIYRLAIRLQIPAEPAAALALATTMLLTGAMHEDGLADSVDALGGKTSEQKLHITRDSRIGAFGACALAMSILLRWSALLAIAEPRAVTVALIVAHAASRAALPVFMHLVPPARTDGLSSGAGQPPGQSVAAALALGIICLVLGLRAKGTMIGLVTLAIAGLVIARITTKGIGGQTGDVLGALQQVGEAALLLVAISFAE